MFKIGAGIGRGFFGALLALAGSYRGLNHLIGPSAPVFRSSFRKGSGGRARHRKYYGDRPPNNTGWWRRNATISPMVITERMLMRHGWYRRKLRKQGVAIDPNAKNSISLKPVHGGFLVRTEDFEEIARDVENLR